MRVGIDAYALGGHLDGTQTHLRNLIRALAAVDPGGEYVLFVRPSLPPGAIAGAERMRRVEIGSATRLVRLPFASSRAVARARIGLLHVQFAAPLLCPARIVVTVHDILFERYPQFFDPGDLKQLKLRVPLTLRRAAAVLTVSEFSKREIVQRYRVPPEKVVVTPNAADPMFRPIGDQAQLAAVRERYGIGAQYILFVGALKPNKNLKTLVEAYVRLRRADAIRHKLVLVGARDWLYDHTFAAARAAGYADELVFTGHVPDEDLVALYSAADLFVQPSLFEGFGLPSLEAMACGTPVVTAHSAAIPEVVGDAALMVDPLDVEALAGAISTVLTDDALRACLSTRGLQRAAAFSWETTARIVMGVYRDVGRTPGP